MRDHPDTVYVTSYIDPSASASSAVASSSVAAASSAAAASFETSAQASEFGPISNSGDGFVPGTGSGSESRAGSVPMSGFVPMSSAGSVPMSGAGSVSMPGAGSDSESRANSAAEFVSGVRSTRAAEASGSARSSGTAGYSGFSGVRSSGVAWASGSAMSSESARSFGSSGTARYFGSAGASGTVRTDTVRRSAEHSAAVRKVRGQRRKVESFAFNPNTVSVEDLQRLGFSQRQAESIEHYRQKGGRFYRAEDFGRSYVVSDSVFARLKSFIRIPKLDINSADSAAFDALPGIGPYYAAQMVKYRERLGGYNCTEQLMELYRFDEERFMKIADLIVCLSPHRFDLWNADEASLAAHPAIRRRDTAHSIILYRESTAPAERSIDGLRRSGILDSLQTVMLVRSTRE